jgi:tRNA threonylcarbamoyladenosine biosynthesis protein TsaE
MMATSVTDDEDVKEEGMDDVKNDRAKSSRVSGGRYHRPAKLSAQERGLCAMLRRDLPHRGARRYNLVMADRRDPSCIPAPETAASPRGVIEIADLAGLDVLAARLAGPARVGDTFALSGELGAGKTALARAFIGALAVRERVMRPSDVPSPTFTLMQSYEIGHLQVFHFDLFRLKSAEEALELGIEDACADGIALIEWPERLGRYLPANRIDVRLAITGEGSRRAEIEPRGCVSERYREFAA